jgi:hypothetical protein
MSEQKIKYIETKPLQREITFNNSQDWVTFFNDYYPKILDYCWDRKIPVDSYYTYQRHKLNKNGMIRMSFNPKHLRTPQAIKKQKQKFAEYCERRKKETARRSLIRQIAECKFKIESQKAILQELNKELEQYGI